MAQIKSEYVVSYNHSWIEVQLKEKSNSPTQLNESASEDLSYELTVQSNSNIDFIYEKCDEIKVNEANKQHFPEKNQNQKSILIGDVEYSIENIDNLTIYIQMELCKETLSEYISRRNKEIIDSNKEFIKANEESILKQFLSICRALNYIHVDEGLIHRDIKPQNILIAFNGSLKLADLGLATKFKNQELKISSPLNLESKRFSFESQSSENYLDLSETQHSITDFHTMNIGTLEYAAPEQINNVFYNQKTDIYSLGLILFELAYPFKTQMEKKSKFNSIKEGVCLKELMESSSIIYNLVKLLINKSPQFRPNANEIIFIIENYLKTKLKHKLDESFELFKFSRKRFFSEDLIKMKAYEIFLSNSLQNNTWRKVLVKIVCGKLLIYDNKNSSKAFLFYDIKDSEIIGKYVTETNEYSPRKSCNKKSRELSKKLKMKRSKSMNLFNDNQVCEAKNSINNLNYVIEITNPYIQNCFLKSLNLIESIEFYNELAKIE